MKYFISILALLPVTFGASNLSIMEAKLDPDVPIYLGDVFWPPTMTFIAWLPSQSNYLNEWCYKATDVSNSKLFTLGGVNDLQIHDYFATQAYLTREGKRFADCSITPEAGRMGACDGVQDWDCEGGHRFTGPGTRRWSCWVVDEERKRLNATSESPVAVPVERLTEIFTPTATGSQGKSSIKPGSRGGS
ncbi:hypothetical protein OIDMADRAFT_141874 [Oidiodendron maius Zn]|uniref:Uncharacterized protein n=1 Tax=Oidiodendron maius (strain Zn) TaxID=913774 RepID=A0A0C3HTD7_OIDMZ|nr:hypothetical protein OIDMADRAFT_141874 [Oidiodendron maius Zn]